MARRADREALFGGAESARADAAAFDSWLNLAAAARPSRRRELLAHWDSAPAARACHPREEHLIPLMVAAGAAGEDTGRTVWRGTMAGMALSAHRFG